MQTKKSWRVERRHWRHFITVKPGDAFEIIAFEQWFENVRGCREAALHLFVKQIPPTDSWHRVDSDRCNFHPLMSALTLVTLLRI